VINRVATYKLFVILTFVLITFLGNLNCKAEDTALAEIDVRENFGHERSLEYVVCSLQLPVDELKNSDLNIVALDMDNNERIPCQIFNTRTFREQNIALIQVIFPVSIDAYASKSYVLNRTSQSNPIKTDLLCEGQGLDLIVENEFYRADLTKSDQSEAKSHPSGQLRELLLKMDFNVKLFRTENRMHWAPNFQRADETEYETIAGWDNPKDYSLDTGPYLIHTMRRDQAPKHPGIILTANYYFYAGLPFFRFYSSMEITDNIWLSLLRNDEMTMDSLFTHVAFQRPNGQIEDYPFSERYKILEDRPIENNASWLCFYHADLGYAFGSIRIRYDTINIQGFDSPTYLPHTKISDGAGGGKYWNRRLIHDHPTFVPMGSRYVEENIYILFETDKKEKFKEIVQWSRLVQHPLQVSVAPVEVKN
jgi:hypothetical protein